MSRGVATGVGIGVAVALMACSVRAAPPTRPAPVDVNVNVNGDVDVAPAPAAAPAPAPATDHVEGDVIDHVHVAVAVNVHDHDHVDVNAHDDALTISIAPPPPLLDPRIDGAGGDGLGRAAPVKGYDVPGYVAFTFDDGPHPAWTARVLAALAAFDVHATFFIVGRSVWGLDHSARRRELAAIAAAGHDIGNHTWSHKRLNEITPLERARQIDQTTAVIRWITGREVTTVRPPYGDTDPEVRRFLWSRGLTEVGWNIDPRDWEAPTPEALRRVTVDRIIRAGGGIVVLHDEKWITAQALPGILEDLEAWNCRRLAAGRAPILPVSLHYFIPRAIPAWVEARTRAYTDGLEARCGASRSVVDNHTAAH